MSSTSLVILNAILALMMFGIALSLKAEDFKRVVLAPKAPLTGILAQFLVLPAMTWCLTMMIPMPAQVALGLILVGSCPGGSFSNIMTYLAKGNTAMSVSMTGIASLAAVGLTPFNFALYASLNPATAELLRQIAVPAGDILLVVILVLALPLSLGLLTGKLAPVFARRSESAFRYVSLFTLLLFVVIALWQNWSQFVAGASVFLLVVILHNALALLAGWGTARGMKLNAADSRAVTLEVGLQNSGLGLGIIFTFFSALTDMAIIAAAWGIWHLISGLSLACLWHCYDRHQAQEIGV